MKMTLDSFAAIANAISDSRRDFLRYWVDGVTDAEGKPLPANATGWICYGKFWAERIQQLNDADIQFRKIRIDWTKDEIEVLEAS